MSVQRSFLFRAYAVHARQTGWDLRGSVPTAALAEASTKSRLLRHGKGIRFPFRGGELVVAMSM